MIKTLTIMSIFSVVGLWAANDNLTLVYQNANIKELRGVFF
jgi:hypothetical protein